MILYDNTHRMVDLGSKVSVLEAGKSDDRYSKYTDKKWHKFLHDHGFKSAQNVPEKWYDMYLVMCAEGMV